MSVVVHDDGTLNDVAYQLGYGDKKNTFTSHPNTGVVFKNVKFSFVDKIISTAKELHGYFSNVGVISWDLTVDNNADIVIIEVNLKGQGVWLPQIIFGKSLFEQNTRSFLTKIAKNRLT